MTRLWWSFGAALALSCVLLACSGSESQPASPTGLDPDIGPFSNTGPPGEPTELDWANLGAELASIGTRALHQSLPASAAGGGSGLRSRWQALGVPTSDVAVEASFLCCGAMPTTHLTVNGQIQGGMGTLSVRLTYDSASTVRWASRDGGRNWDLDLPGGLLLTSTLATSGGSVASTQQIRLGGTVVYLVPSGETRSAPINLVLDYLDFEGGAPTATGTMGPLEIPSLPLPGVGEPERCSRPQEGCGPLVAGPCPCTLWPPCPVYGITCSGS